MVPDKGFTKQLKALDKELEVVWNWGQDKWEIWRFPEDGKPPHYVLAVQTKGRTYRELGTDVLLKLRAGDPARFTTSELLSYFDELDTQVQRRKEKEMRAKIEDITRETWRYVLNIPTIQVPKSFKIRRAITDA